MSYNQGGYGGGGGYGQGGYSNQPYSQSNYNQGAGYGQGQRFEPNRNQGPASPYASSYGQTPRNPYAQSADRYDGGGYRNAGVAAQNGDSMEMTQVTGNGNEPLLKRILSVRDDCVIDRHFTQLEELQNRHIASADPDQYRTALAKKQSEIDIIIANCTERLTELGDELKDKPNKTDLEKSTMKQALDNLRKTQTKNKDYDLKFRTKEKETRRRQYKIVNPAASESEIREYLDNTEYQDGQVFAETLLNADRRGQASSILKNVQDRHEAIQKIESDMVKLAETFEQLNNMVQTQEPQVQQIEQGAQQTETYMGNAVEELETAKVKARAARRKKWICLGICVAILVIIVIIIIIVVEVEKN